MKSVVIVGGGLAGLRAVETLRRGGFDGALMMICAEAELPYDRPPLSKQVLTGEIAPEDSVFRSADHYASLDVEVIHARVSSLCLAEQTVTADSRAIPFDAALIATGAIARPLDAGGSLAGVHTLRTLDDARRVRGALGKASSLVVVGAGFIGSEVASSARARGLEVTLVELAATPLVRSVGVEMGTVCATLHADHGTRLRCGAGVAALEGHGCIEQVRLTNGEALAADLVVVGVGVEPDVSWLVGSGLELRDGVVCDSTLNAGHPAVYAAGDVVRWRNPLFGDEMRCEQWTNAAEQGMHAAKNILRGGRGALPFAGSNYFWSDQYGTRIQFVGIPDADEVCVVAGSVDERRFLALYRRGTRIVGAFAMGMAKALMTAKVLVESQASWVDALARTRETSEAA